MSVWFSLLLPVLLVVPAPGSGNRQEAGTGQSAELGEAELAVRERVERLLQLTGQLRYYALPRYFANNANIVRVELHRNGSQSWVETAEQWIESLKTQPGWVPHEEVLSNVEITIESEALALMKADFRIFRGPELRSHGFQVFTLIKQEGEWRIASIAFTTFPDWTP